MFEVRLPRIHNAFGLDRNPIEFEDLIGIYKKDFQRLIHKLIKIIQYQTNFLKNFQLNGLKIERVREFEL